MSKFYKIKFDPNKRYLLEICSLEKRYIYYRDNFKRLCIENHKLQKELNYYKEKEVQEFDERDYWED